MDTGIEKTREISLKQIVKGTDTRLILERAKRQADKRKYGDYFLVDVDAHHFESQSWAEIVECIPNDVIRDIAKSFKINGRITPGIIQTSSFPNLQDVGGRVPHSGGLEEQAHEPGVHRDVVLIRRAIEMIGLNYQVTFPTPMLSLGLHPQPEVEGAVAEGYNKWLVENVLAADKRILSMLYLPFNDPESCERIVERYAGAQGVAGFMVTSVRYKPVHHNSYMRLYRMIEERGLPLGFHAGPNWGGEAYLAQLNRFISAHAISFVLCSMVHMTNWIINALPERFPKLKLLWIESGVAWIPFMMQRLDNEFLMRSSEAPNLKRMPSEYIKEMYFSSQPMERTNMKMLKATFEFISAETQLLYASDWPHWDFDLPSTIYDLSFLTDQGRRNIMGLNAKRLFNIAG